MSDVNDKNLMMSIQVALILTDDEEQHQLESLGHRSRSALQVASRARIILACAGGHDSKVVARRLHATPATVCKWRGRFVRQQVDVPRLKGRLSVPASNAVPVLRRVRVTTQRVRCQAICSTLL